MLSRGESLPADGYDIEAMLPVGETACLFIKGELNPATFP